MSVTRPAHRGEGGPDERREPDRPPDPRPELTATPNGTQIAKLRLALDRRRREGGAFFLDSRIVEVFDFGSGDVREAAFWLALTAPADLTVLCDWRAFGGGADKVGKEDAGSQLWIWLVEWAQGARGVGVIPLGHEVHGRVERLAGAAQPGEDARQAVTPTPPPASTGVGRPPAHAASVWRDWNGDEKVATFRLPAGKDCRSA